MSNIITMRCSIGHRWVLPLPGTRYVVIPERCPKCIKEPNTTIAADVTFPDNNAPAAIVDKQ
jgi:hypothetical protein